MAKKTKKASEVSKFGGAEFIGSVKDENVTAFRSEMTGEIYEHKNTNYDVQSVEAQSDIKLEDDIGQGQAAIIRCFEFGINTEAFKQYTPTKQELFNSHYKGLEMALWRDGLKVIPEVAPRITLNEEKGTYSIFIGAVPQRGSALYETPQTLAQLTK